VLAERGDERGIVGHHGHVAERAQRDDGLERPRRQDARDEQVAAEAGPREALGLLQGGRGQAGGAGVELAGGDPRALVALDVRAQGDAGRLGARLHGAMLASRTARSALRRGVAERRTRSESNPATRPDR
jgi:hypothetical protein